jgi:DNA-binding response OmpR family regulator
VPSEGVAVRFHGRVDADKGLVLVVEDEPAIADLERLYLTQAGFGVHTERDGLRALHQIRALRPALVILDVGLPGMDGFDVCRKLRERSGVPIVMLTARDEEPDRVAGLEVGADDYVTKPFSPRELVARVSGMLRRARGTTGGAPLELGDVRLEPVTRRVEVAGVEVHLTATEFDLLAALLRRPGQVFTREQLLASVWGTADYGGSRTVDVHVAQLRAKLGPLAPIRTHRGVGYSAAAP